MNKLNLTLAGLLLFSCTPIFSSNQIPEKSGWPLPHFFEAIQAFEDLFDIQKSSHPKIDTEINAPENALVSEGVPSNKLPFEIHTQPSSGIWTIDGDFGAHQIQLVDFKRTVVHFQKGEKTPVKINLEKLPSGSYTLLLRDDENRLLGSEKIRKE